MVWASLLLIVLLTLGLAAVIQWPVRRTLKERERDELRAYSAFIRSEISGFFAEAEQLARQVPSRTRIREELVAMLEGDRSLESYVEYTQPKLFDAVEASARLVAVYRLGPDREPIVGVNIAAEELPRLHFSAQRTILQGTTAQVDGELVAFFVVPIRQEGFGLAGYDVVAVSLNELIGRTDRAAEQAQDAHVAIAAIAGEDTAVPIYSDGCPDHMREALRVIAAGTQPGDPGPAIFREVQAGECTLLMAAYELRAGWVLGVAQNRRTLYANADSQTRWFLGGIGFLGLVAAVVAAVVLRLLSRRVVADTRELTGIIEDQTRDLELLLKEIHHRVKNDIGMLSSFLAVKSWQTETAEAKEALEEAQNSLQVMGRVYERLQNAEHYTVASVRPLIEGIISDLQGGTARGASVTHEVEDVTVPRRVAIPLGIIVNELVTNGLKYGAPGEDVEEEHHVTVQLHSTERSRLRLRVESPGPGFPQRVLDGEYGFGLQMVQLLTGQYKGSVEITNDPVPTVTVEIPVDDLEEQR